MKQAFPYYAGSYDNSAFAKSHLKGNEKLNLTLDQLSYLFAADPWGVKLYLTEKNDKELTKNLFWKI
jgi:hypothetical protein